MRVESFLNDLVNIAPTFHGQHTKVLLLFIENLTVTFSNNIFVTLYWVLHLDVVSIPERIYQDNNNID